MKRVFASALAAFGLISASLLAGGCQSTLYDENAALHDQNRKLQTHLSATSGELQTRPTQAEVATLRAELDARDQMIRDLQDRLNAPQPDGTSIPGIDGVTITMEGNQLTMSVAGDVLFASGSTTINKSAEATLARIAEVLNRDYAGKPIRVEGHTDTDPINKTKNLYADNRDLSLKRAYAVTKFLEGKSVQPARLETVGHGEYKPRNSNKKDNRRVEIIVVI